MLDASLVGALKKLATGIAERKAPAVAYLFAPSVVMTIGFLMLGKAPLVDQPEDAVTLVEFHSGTTSNGSVGERSAVLLVLEGASEPFAVPLAGHPAGILATLDREALLMNQDRLHVSQSTFRVDAPLLGFDPIGVLLPETKVNGMVSFPGRQVDPEDLHLPSRRSLSVALWGLVASLGVFLSCVLEQTGAEGSRGD